MSKPIRILIVDDQELIRRGIRMLLDHYDDLHVVGEAADGKEALQLTQRLAPDVILLDLIMPVYSGIDTLSAILGENQHARVIILTAIADQETVLSAIQMGASGYLLKSATPADLINAIRSAYQGGMPLNPQVANIVVRTLGQTAALGKAYGKLTKREQEVLQLLAQGKTNRDIARELSLAVPTIRVYVWNILKKLNLRNRTQASLYFLREQKRQRNHRQLRSG